MTANAQLQELLFGLQNPTNEKLFIDRCAKLFDPDDSRTWIDVYQPRIAAPIRTEASATNNAPGDGPLPKGETGHRIGDDIDYLGRCAVPCYRETNVEDLRSRIEQINAEQDDLAGSNLPKRPLFCIVRQRHSWSRLLTSHALLEYVLSTFDPRVNDFILPFGFKMEETNIGGPRLWFYPTSFGSADQGVERTKYYGQTPLQQAAIYCAYTLKYVERSRRDIPSRPWAERQTTIATHCGEIGGWVLVSPSITMQEYLDRYMRALKDDERENTFAIHLLFIEAAMTNWQPYMEYLTKETREGTNRAIVTNYDNDNIKTLFLEDPQRLQTIHDRFTDMFAMLDSTVDITSSLEEKYHIFHLGLDAVAKSRVSSDPIAFAFHEKLKELKFIRQKLECLHENLKAIMQLSSSLLSLENGHSLRTLAQEAQREGKVMHGLTVKATQDAAAVKVITVITMIYLPLTVVANFFSTVFVTRTSDGATNTIQVASNWWILAAVGFPLTAVTFFTWWAISQRMFLLDALRQLRTMSTDHLRFLASREGSKNSVSDQESIAGSAMVLGAVIT